MSCIKIDGLNIHYEQVGNDSGKDVVLLHGWGSKLQIFKHIVSELEPDFNVYAIDFPGFGESNPPNEEWGVNDYTLFLEAFVKKLNIKNPILMGHSFGGRVAILYSSRNEVNKLVLIDSAGIKPKRSLKYYLKVYSFKLYKRILPVLLGKEKADILIERYRKKAGSSDYNAAAGIMRKILVKVVNEDLKQIMPQIKAPTLLIWGENDTAAPVKDARIMEKLIQDSGLVVLQNAGHFSFIEKPGEVNIILNVFLKDDKSK
ncbi:alpha/beta hydrolase [Bacteroidia bacterium]|nr:alpha/beta hydrolase [Bacteroidia bacterium]GHV07626.1 alpha/beta hydrolase [Bacteroidia bacterium]